MICRACGPAVVPRARTSYRAIKPAVEPVPILEHEQLDRPNEEAEQEAVGGAGHQRRSSAAAAGQADGDTGQGSDHDHGSETLQLPFEPGVHARQRSGVPAMSTIAVFLPSSSHGDAAIHCYAVSLRS